MARYIDAEALTAEFKRLTLGENSLIERIFADGVYSVIDTFPTADVVPASEVIQLERNIEQCENGYRQEMHLLQCKLTDAKTEIASILAELMKEIRAIADNYERWAKAMINDDYARISYRGSQKGAMLALLKIAELKKKYTEGR